MGTQTTLLAFGRRQMIVLLHMTCIHTKNLKKLYFLVGRGPADYSDARCMIKIFQGEGEGQGR